MVDVVLMNYKEEDNLEEKKNELHRWLVEHKKQLIIGGLSITAIMGIILGLKNKDAIMELWLELDKIINKSSKIIPEETSVVQVSNLSLGKVVSSYAVLHEPVDVKQHLRMLPEGKLHSMEKAIEAESLGIVLLPNQTIVNSYTKWAA